MPRLNHAAAEKPTSITQYLASRAALVLVMMAAVAGMSILALRQIEQDSVRLAAQHLPRFKTAVHLALDANAASALSVRMAGAESQAERRSLLDRLSERHRAMEDHIAHLTEIGASASTISAVRRLRDSLMDGGLALSALSQEDIALRQSAVQDAGAAERLAELDRRRRNLILRQQDLSSELAAFVSALTADAEQRFDQQRAQAEDQVTRNLILVAVCGVGATAALAWMYVGLRRRVIGRVLDLRRALQDRGIGTTVLPNQGNDEITAMTATLQHLLDTLDQRNRTLEDMAASDPLTGLSNRRRFSERAEEEIRRARRYSAPLSAIVGDIDHFKAVNDGWGHEIGDVALIETAEIWRDSLRDVDLSARMGGEEFVALLPETDLPAAQAAAERIRRRLAETRIAVGEGAELSLTISLGVVAAAADEDLTHMLRRADQAMYRAKKQGRNTVCSG